MPQTANVQFAGLDEALTKEFKTLSPERREELGGWLKQLLVKCYPSRLSRTVEAVEYSRTLNTVTVFTRTYSLECGLNPHFGAPRLRQREFLPEVLSESFISTHREHVQERATTTSDERVAPSLREWLEANDGDDIRRL